ncbi:MAG: hypothetical protein IT509_08160 [Rhodocyclaceae bacterium]|nr:hypothetical protein [Rhodocyclaceae bacterium]
MERGAAEDRYSNGAYCPRVSFVERLVLSMTRPGGLVFDPFALDALRQRGCVRYAIRNTRRPGNWSAAYVIPRKRFKIFIQLAKLSPFTPEEIERAKCGGCQH